MAALADQPPTAGVSKKRTERMGRSGDLPRHGGWFDEMVTLIGKIDGRLEARDEIEPPRLDAGERVRDALRIRPGQADDADAAASRRRGDRHDRVVGREHRLAAARIRICVWR